MFIIGQAAALRAAAPAQRGLRTLLTLRWRGGKDLILARYSCAPASYRIGRDGACTRLLLDGQEERDENV